MKETIIIVILIVGLIILYMKKSDYSTTPWDFLMVPPLYNVDYTGDLLDVLINTITGDSYVSNVNSIISKCNAVLTTKLIPYTNDAQLNLMFKTADTSGEAGLSRTDKFILRIISVVGYELYAVWCGLGILACAFDSNGKVPWANEIFQQTGIPTISGNMLKLFRLNKKYMVLDQDALTEINAILPSNLVKFTGFNDFTSRINTSDPTVIWFKKYMSIGPLFLYWKAKNVWNLDPSVTFS
jgi:hypothetical protein